MTSSGENKPTHSILTYCKLFLLMSCDLYVTCLVTTRGYDKLHYSTVLKGILL